MAAAGYAEALFGLGSGRLTTFAVAGAVLWLAALNNLAGTRSVGAVAVATTVLKITALAIVAVAGLLAFHAGHVGPVRARGGSWTALPSASALLLFSFLGMESAAVATNRVRDPERSVPRAIIAGVAGVAVLYLAGTLAVQGTVPQARRRIRRPVRRRRAGDLRRRVGGEGDRHGGPDLGARLAQRLQPGQFRDGGGRRA